jgi:poly(3-hydroxybutyrate) depolymerase
MTVMRRTTFVVLFACAAAIPAAQTPSPLDNAFRAFWEADSVAAAERLADRVVATGASFDAIASRLKAGRPYGNQKTGRVDVSSHVDGMTLDNVAEVPVDYNPAHPIALRVSLHGGVGRPAPAPGEQLRPLANRIPGGSEIVLHPRSWADLEWWKVPQVENILRLVDRLKRAYNVDESHIYLTGISDGGTGVYYLAMRAATPWSSCLPLNGQPLVIANPETGADGELYATNLVNCPLHAVNGGRDRLYPAVSVKPVIDMFQGGGIPILWQVFPNADHDTSWWPEEKTRYMDFVATHARVAHPPTISWTTERTDRFNRFRWLIIDRLGERKSDTALKDVNTFDLQGRRAQLFARRRPAGRVDVSRTGNAFDAKTRGVAGFTLLLSADAVDFDKPVQVTVNGHSAFTGTVKRDPGVLMRWASRDNDRTMLYAAELKIAVP